MTILRRYPWQIAGLVAFTLTALLMTMTVANTLARRDSGDTRHYSVMFTDASGIRVGDDVRIAGVRVGRVKGRELEGRAREGRHRRCRGPSRSY